MFGLTKRIALIVLSVWLMLTGLFSLAGTGFTGAGLILNLLAIGAGVLILLQGDSWSARIGMILLGAWLVARGLLGVVDVGVQGIGMIMDLVAIAAGVLILVER
ncbi:MAG: hypothetical protein R6X31_05665 [Anaerolineae bacterium]